MFSSSFFFQQLFILTVTSLFLKPLKMSKNPERDQWYDMSWLRKCTETTGGVYRKRYHFNTRRQDH